jgi:hypothetical protein
MLNKKKEEENKGRILLLANQLNLLKTNEN